MAEIRELVLTFLERLSHHALPKNRKRETLDACIDFIVQENEFIIWYVTIIIIKVDQKLSDLFQGTHS